MKKLLILVLLLSFYQEKTLTSDIQQKSMINFMAIHALSATAGYIGLNSIARGLFLAINVPYPFDKNVVFSGRYEEDSEFIRENIKKGGIVSLFGALMLAAGVIGLKISFDNALKV
jgi:hypothetical protein